MDDRTPTRDVIIPLLQSLVSGILVAVFVLSVGLVADWAKVGAISGLAGTGAALYAWLRLLPKQQTDEPILEPHYLEPETTRVIITNSDNTQGTFIDLVEDEKLIAMAARLVQGAAFNHANFSGPHRLFSRAEFELLRDKLLSRGLVRWKSERSHNQGLAVTGKGMALMRHYAAMVSPAPTLIERVGGRDSQ